MLDDTLPFDDKMKLVHKVKHELLHNNIQHATLELESAGMPCAEPDC